MAKLLCSKFVFRSSLLIILVAIWLPIKVLAVDDATLDDLGGGGLAGKPNTYSYKSPALPQTSAAPTSNSSAGEADVPRQAPPPPDVGNQNVANATTAGNAGDAVAAENRRLDENGEAETKANGSEGKEIAAAAKLNQQNLSSGKPGAAEDERLIKSAAKLYANGDSLDKTQLQQAVDPKIREHLLKAAEQDNVQQTLQKEDDRIIKNMAALAQVASAAAGLAANMKTAGKDPAQSGGISGSADVTNSSGLDGSAEKTAEAQTGSTGGPEATEAEASSAADPAAIKALLKKGMSHKLRDTLKKKLAAMDAVSASSQFTGRLTFAGPLGNGASGDASTGSTQGSVLSAAVAEISKAEGNNVDENFGSTFGNGGAGFGHNGFSMRSSETDAEVKRMTEEGSRELAAASSAAILSENSASLFQRIHEVHTVCAEHSCVVGAP